MTIKFKHFQVPGIQIMDLCRHLKIQQGQLKTLAKQAGVELFYISPNRYQPLSNEQAGKIIALKRLKEGQKIIDKIDSALSKK